MYGAMVYQLPARVDYVTCLEGAPVQVEEQDSLCSPKTIGGAVRVGGAEYFFREPVTGWFNPWTGEFRVFELPFLSGSGDRPGESFRDWQRSLHSEFQKLMFTRDFDLDEAEARKKRALERVIDVTRYKNTTPYVTQRIGCVDQARPYPSRIKWMDGRTYSIDFDHASDPRLGSLRIAQWVEAQVRVDPRTDQIMEVVAARPLRRRPVGDDGASGELPIIKLPESNRPWTR